MSPLEAIAWAFVAFVVVAGVAFLLVVLVALLAEALRITGRGRDS